MKKAEIFEIELETEVTGWEMAALCMMGGSFDFLKDEPDDYSRADIKEVYSS